MKRGIRGSERVWATQRTGTSSSYLQSCAIFGLCECCSLCYLYNVSSVLLCRLYINWRLSSGRYSACSVNTWKWRRKFEKSVLGHSLMINATNGFYLYWFIMQRIYFFNVAEWFLLVCSSMTAGCTRTPEVKRINILIFSTSRCHAWKGL